MGECRCAAASLWLEHALSIGLAIGPRHSEYITLWDIARHIMSFSTVIHVQTI